MKIRNKTNKYLKVILESAKKEDLYKMNLGQKEVEAVWSDYIKIKSQINERYGVDDK